MDSLAFLRKVRNRIDKFVDSHNGKCVIVIWGATATGKTRLSVALSDFFPVSVVSCDSRQIFRFMDIGTDKVSKEVRTKIPHYQIDIIDPDEHYTAGQWQSDAKSYIEEIFENKRIPFVVGGTGLYIDTIYKNFEMPGVSPDKEFRSKLYALENSDPGILRKKLHKIDPEEATIHHPHSLRYIVRALEIHRQTGRKKSSFMKRCKPDWPILMIGLWRSKEDTNRRINLRVKEMIEEGLISETQFLLNKGYDPQLQSMQGIGYKQTVDYLCEHRDLDLLLMDIKKATHRLSKKQRSWFRRYIADQKIGFDDISYDVYNLG